MKTPAKFAGLPAQVLLDYVPQHLLGTIANLAGYGRKLC